MDITAVWTLMVGIVGSTIYFVPKLRKYKADTESTSVSTLEKAMKSLTAAYDKKVELMQDGYLIEISNVGKKYDGLKHDFEQFKKRQLQKDADLENIKIAVLERSKCDRKNCPIENKLKGL
jgi:hypothetical protein